LAQGLLIVCSRRQILINSFWQAFLGQSLKVVDFENNEAGLSLVMVIDMVVCVCGVKKDRIISIVLLLSNVRRS
jgi:hypothetical protein